MPNTLRHKSVILLVDPPAGGSRNIRYTHKIHIHLRNTGMRPECPLTTTQAQERDTGGPTGGSSDVRCARKTHIRVGNPGMCLGRPLATVPQAQERT